MRTTKVRFEGISADNEEIGDDSEQKGVIASSTDNQKLKSSIGGNRIKKNNRYASKMSSNVIETREAASIESIKPSDKMSIKQTEIERIIKHVDYNGFRPNAFTLSTFKHKLFSNNVDNTSFCKNNNILVSLHLNDFQNISAEEKHVIKDDKLITCNEKQKEPEDVRGKEATSPVDEGTSNVSGKSRESTTTDLKRNRRFNGSLSKRLRYTELYCYTNTDKSMTLSNHKCSICDMRFKYLANLKSHLFYVHNMQHSDDPQTGHS